MRSASHGVESVFRDMTQQITLYTSKICPYAARAQIALREARVEFKEYEIDLQNKPEWYQPKINPASKVPALTFGGPDVPADQPAADSAKLRESLAIIEWVADQHPNSTLLPKDPLVRYKIRLFIDTLSSILVPGFYRYVFRDGDPETLVKGFEALQEFLSEDTTYAVSNEFTNADVAAAPFLGRMEMTLRNDVGMFAPGEGKKMYEMLAKDPKFKTLWKYLVALKERPSFKETFPEDYLLQSSIRRVDAARKAKADL